VFQWLNRHKPLCNGGQIVGDDALHALFQWLNRHKPLCNEERRRIFETIFGSFNGSIAISLFATVLSVPL